MDAAIAAGGEPGRLAGVPYAVKNLFDLAGTVTTAGSKILRDAPPATRDATAVARLQAAGAVCLGALNMGEFAYDFVTENAHAGPTCNPRDLDPLGRRFVGRFCRGRRGRPRPDCARHRHQRVDSCAVVLLRRLGSQANLRPPLESRNVSVRGEPRSRRPVRAFGRRFGAHLRHLAGTGSARPGLHDAPAGGDGDEPRDQASTASVSRSSLDTFRTAATPLCTRPLNESPTPLEPRDVSSSSTWTRLAPRRFSSPRPRAGDYIWIVSGRARPSSTRPHATGCIAGAMLPAAWYIQAQKFRAWWREQVLPVFDEVDVLLAPATPVPATHLGQETMTIDGRELLVRANLGLFTQPISFIGLPVVAAPIHSAAGRAAGCGAADRRALGRGIAAARGASPRKTRRLQPRRRPHCHERAFSHVLRRRRTVHVSIQAGRVCAAGHRHAT